MESHGQDSHNHCYPKYTVESGFSVFGKAIANEHRWLGAEAGEECGRLYGSGNAKNWHRGSRYGVISATAISGSIWMVTSASPHRTARESKEISGVKVGEDDVEDVGGLDNVSGHKVTME